MIDLNSRVAFDLTDLADELERRSKTGDKRFEKYRIAIEELESAASIFRDLVASRKSLDILIELHDDETARQTLGQPLFTHAVLCYCRALVSETNARRRINVHDKAYNKDLIDKHLAIKKLRSTALAHYHKGEGKFGDIWIKDRLAVRPVHGSLSSSDLFIRTNFLGAAVRALNDLLEAAIPYVEKERIRRMALVDELLNRANREDQALIERLKAHRFDPETFFSSGYDTETFWHNVDVQEEKYQTPGIDI